MYIWKIDQLLQSNSIVTRVKLTTVTGCSAQYLFYLAPHIQDMTACDSNAYSKPLCKLGMRTAPTLIISSFQDLRRTFIALDLLPRGATCGNTHRFTIVSKTCVVTSHYASQGRSVFLISTRRSILFMFVRQILSLMLQKMI